MEKSPTRCRVYHDKIRCNLSVGFSTLCEGMTYSLIRISFATLFAFALGCVEHTKVDAKPSPQTEKAVFTHQTWTKVLETVVDDRGLVDYQRLVENRAGLDNYVGQIAASSPISHPQLFPTKDDKIAYWINAYNALMILAVVDHYPIDSVTKIKVAHGVFKRLTFPVGGQAMTLDGIEKGILLKQYPDPRIHFALTCASISCPYLDRSAFTAAGLSKRLQREGRHFLNSADGVVLDIKGGTLKLSRYFKWYGSDFGTDPKKFIRPYLTATRQQLLDQLANARIEYLPYDWRLNDKGRAWTKDRRP